jgi:tagatose 6-phosphate kinase
VIVALTPNLTLDRVLTLDRPLVPGQLHRARTLSVAAGGKGVNLARAVRVFGGEVCVAGVVGGFGGQRFEFLLDAEGLSGVLERGQGETRECHILLGEPGQHPTEINETGPDYQPDVTARLLSRLPAGQVAVCGSLAPGMTQAEFTELLRRLGRPVVDSSGIGLHAALDAGASLIKPNEHELSALTGSGSTVSDSIAAAQDLYRRTGAEVLLTLGARGAALVGQQIILARPPAIQVRNPVGSGDTLLGAFLQARAEGQPDADALRLGVAAGAANAALGGPLAFAAAGAGRRETQRLCGLIDLTYDTPVSR